MSPLEACGKEITRNREMFVQLGERSHCFLSPRYTVIFMCTSQAVNIHSVLPFGVRSRQTPGVQPSVLLFLTLHRSKYRCTWKAATASANVQH